MTNKEKIALDFPAIQAKLIKLNASVNVKGTLDAGDKIILEEIIDWLNEWGEEQERLYEERTGEPFPKLTGIHSCS